MSGFDYSLPPFKPLVSHKPVASGSSSAESTLNDEIQLAQAYHKVSAYISPRDISLGKNKHASKNADDMTASIKILRAAGMVEGVFNDFRDEVKAQFHLVDKDIKRYLRLMEEATAVSLTPENQINILMNDLFDRLHAWQRGWGSNLKVIDATTTGGPGIYTPLFTTLFHLLLHTHLTSPTFLKHLTTYLTLTLPATTSAAKKATIPSQHLYRVGIFPRYANVLVDIAYGEIGRVVRKMADGEWEEEGKEESMEGEEKEEKGPWEERKMEALRRDIRERIMVWLALFIQTNESMYQSKKNIDSRLEFRMMNDLFDSLSKDLFDIIVDFPKSTPALEDLKECATRTGRRSELVDQLRASHKKRLLHPGAATKDVIEIYTNTIKCVKILDPQGALLHKIATPIRSHLRARPDTIKCIVAALVENELDEEEENHSDRVKQIQIRDEQAEDFTDPHWEPEPVDAAPEFRHRKASDIISTLVSIFDSRELIVTEIQNILATRLLAIKDYELEREVRTIELLKLRFGDAALQVCQVMLKDMADSKRVDTHVQGEMTTNLHPLVLSRLYWPELATSKLKIPKDLKRMQKRYQREFRRFKPDKTLHFLPQLGAVSLKIELKDRVVEVEATPAQAAVIDAFSSESRWNLLDLETRLTTGDPMIVKHALNFWINEGVVKQEEWGSYVLLEEKFDGPKPHLDMGSATEYVSGLIHAMQTHRWYDIRDLIRAKGPQTTAQISEALATVIPPYNQPPEALQLFLHSARRENLLQLGAEGWALVELGPMGGEDEGLDGLE